MKNFFIEQKNNYIPLIVPYENIQNNNNNMTIHKIIIYPVIKEYQLKIKLIINNQLILFNSNIFFDNNNISESTNAIESENMYKNNNKEKKIAISYKYKINDGYVELYGWEFKGNKNEINNNELEFDIYLNNYHHGSFNNKNFLNAIICFNIIPCQFLKIYISNNLINNTIEMGINNDEYTQIYNNLISVKKPIGLPIEIHNDDFPIDIHINNNSILYITDQDNKKIELNKIYLFYSLN